MTFTEAAAEVLRLVGKPLHYKDITELAIEKNLLSHVGKSPEVTMGSRLAALLKKGPKENPLVRIKPGVFALRAWEESGPPGPPPEVKAAAEAAAAEAAAKAAEAKANAPGREGAKPRASRATTPPPGLPAASTLAAATPGGALEASDDEPPTAPAIGGAASRRARDAGAARAAEASVFAGGASSASEGVLAPLAPPSFEAAPAAEATAAVIVPGAVATAPVPGLAAFEAAPESERGDPEATVDALPRKLERGEPARPERGEAARLEQSDAARGERGEPARAERGEAARAERGEAMRAERGEATRGERGEATRGEPARGERGEPARGERGEPARGERVEAARPEREAAKPPRAPAKMPTAPDEAFRANLVEAAKDLFDEEEDDDKPIFGTEADAAEAAGSRRRRRRRRGRGAEGAEASAVEPGGLPAYTVSPAYGDQPAGGEVAREVEPASVRPGLRDAPRETPREPFREAARDAPRETPREPFREGPREPFREGPREGRRDERRDDRGPRPGAGFEGGAEGEGEELAGRDLTDLVATLLAGFDRSGGPVPLRALVEQAQRRGKLAGEPSLLQAQMAAALRADGLRRAASGQRPRFRLLSGGRVAPVDWSLGLELVRLEAEMLVAVERYREASRRAFGRKLAELPPHGFVELCLTVLERLGVAGLRSVRRPTSGGAESHFSGVLRGPAGETRLAVIIRRDGREVGRERVADLRGSLHHYGPAAAGWVFTAGPVLSGAREEVAVAGASPVALFDAATLARVCEEHEIAVARTMVPVLVPDFETLDALRGGER